MLYNKLASVIGDIASRSSINVTQKFSMPMKEELGFAIMVTMSDGMGKAAAPVEEAEQ